MKKTLSALALSALPTFALATMSNAPSTDDQLGSPIEASRTIKHVMLANMQLISSEISMQAGDTVRFSIGNSGKISNDMFLNTPLSEHAHINSTFGQRLHPVSGKWVGHQGLDYPAPRGTPIRATAQGEITFIGTQNGYGKVIFIMHDNDYSTVYAHQSRFKRGLKKGATIEKGQVIGYVGSTGIASGPHLHYELRVNNQPVDPITEKRQLASYSQR